VNSELVMKHILKHISQPFSRQAICFLLICLFLGTNIFVSTPNIVSSIAVETEREEGKEEKEDLGEEELKSSHASKNKKYKKNLPQYNLYKQPRELVIIPLAYSLVALENTVLLYVHKGVALPYYITFHKLIFYEV
jgi:hypothetical protein